MSQKPNEELCFFIDTLSESKFYVLRILRCASYDYEVVSFYLALLTTKYHKVQCFPITVGDEARFHLIRPKVTGRCLSRLHHICWNRPHEKNHQKTELRLNEQDSRSWNTLLS